MATTPDPGGRPEPVSSLIQTRRREVQVTADKVQPPTMVYVQPEDVFRLSVFIPTRTLPVTVTAELRWLRADGEIVPVKKTFICTVTTPTFLFAMGEGYLLSCVVGTPPVAPTEPGAVFIVLQITRSPQTDNVLNLNLIQDYATGVHDTGWPYGRLLFPQEGPGQMRSIVGTTPGAGAEISETVPTSVRWALIAFRVSLTTSAVVANRKPSLIIDDGVNTLLQSDSNLTVVASNNGQVTLCNTGFVNAAITNAAGVAPCPPFLLSPGFRIRTTTSGLDVGDQYASPKYLVQEWVNG